VDASQGNGRKEAYDRDPERLLSISSGSDPLERELLGSVRHVGPPTARKLKLGATSPANRVVAAVGAVSSSTARLPARSASAAGNLGTFGQDGGSRGWQAGLAFGGGYLVLHGTQESPAVAPRTVVAPVTQRAAAAPPPAPKRPKGGADRRRTGRRRAEPQARARPALMRSGPRARYSRKRAQSFRSGNAAGAQASLDRLQAQFPKGIAHAKREVLAIEVLSARAIPKAPSAAPKPSSRATEEPAQRQARPLPRIAASSSPRRIASLTAVVLAVALMGIQQGGGEIFFWFETHGLAAAT